MKYEVQLTYFSLNFLQIAKKKSAGTTLARDATLATNQRNKLPDSKFGGRFSKCDITASAWFAVPIN